MPDTCQNNFTQHVSSNVKRIMIYRIKLFEISNEVSNHF